MNKLKAWIIYLLMPLIHLRYKANQAITDEEKKAIFKLRYKVYIKELRYGFMKSYVHGKELYDPLDFADNTILLYTGSIKKPLGTCRLRYWKTEDLPPDIIEKYHLETVDLKKVACIGEISNLMIKKTLRSKIYALVLLIKVIEVMNEKKIFPEIIFAHALPNLINSYSKLGVFLYSNKLIYTLDTISIPFAYLTLSPIENKKLSPILYLYSKWLLKNNISYLSNLGYTYPDGKKFENIIHIKPIKKIQQPPSNEQEIFVQDVNDLTKLILKKARPEERLFLNVEKDKLILTQGVKDSAIYLVLDGEFEVFLASGKKICVFKKGEIFGELSMLLEPKVRSANVKALTDGSLLMIKNSLFFRLLSQDPKSSSHLFLLLCKVLAQKLVETNKKLDHEE